MLWGPPNEYRWDFEMLTFPFGLPISKTDTKLYYPGGGDAIK